MADGDYEMRGDPPKVTGRCAGCVGDVEAGDPYVIVYSTSGEPGGIFHKRCKPQGNQWYGLDPVDNEKPVYDEG